MTVIDVHGRLANTALLYAIILGVWGLWRFIRKQSMDSNYWGALVIAEVLILVQIALGLYLWLSGVGELSSGVHVLYGVVSVMVLPGIYLYTRGDDKRRVLIIYSAGFLFLVGILIRAMVTAG
ncbi:MAG TPA: hypothetical protein VLM80_04895 [Anaerolineales bacterium]|nr:hypothetical protein [Anaerolineales bacterium]